MRRQARFAVLQAGIPVVGHNPVGVLLHGHWPKGRRDVPGHRVQREGHPVLKIVVCGQRNDLEREIRGRLQGDGAQGDRTQVHERELQRKLVLVGVIAGGDQRAGLINFQQNGIAVGGGVQKDFDRRLLMGIIGEPQVASAFAIVGIERGIGRIQAVRRRQRDRQRVGQLVIGRRRLINRLQRVLVEASAHSDDHLLPGRGQRRGIQRGEPGDVRAGGHQHRGNRRRQRNRQIPGSRRVPQVPDRVAQRISRFERSVILSADLVGADFAVAVQIRRVVRDQLRLVKVAVGRIWIQAQRQGADPDLIGA